MTGTTNTTAPREIGRPSKYSPKLAGEILQRLASGEMLMGILRRKGMPGRSSVYRWMKEKQDFRDSYARARETGAHSLVEEGLAILDASTPERAHLDNSRANYRRWLAGKMNARYRSKPAAELTGSNGGPAPESAQRRETRFAAVQDRLDQIRKMPREEKE